MRQLFVALGIALAAALIIGGEDSRSAVITAKHERAAAEKKADVKPASRVWIGLPFECNTWIAKCSAGQVCRPIYNCAADLTKRAAK